MAQTVVPKFYSSSKIVKDPAKSIEKEKLSEILQDSEPTIGVKKPVQKSSKSQKAAVYKTLSNQDLASIVNESGSKILFNERLDELKKSLESFSSNNKEPTPIIKGEAASKSETFFYLPYKYKLLGETFCCFDTVVKMMYNRKEKITFAKVKSGIQDMMKQIFLMDDLGQIMSVFPAAYSLQYEKCDSYTIKKNSPSSLYQLIITPILCEIDGNSADVTSVTDKKNNQNNFTSMTPQHLLERQHIFEQNLIAITKKHHQEFLKTRRFSSVSEEKILRWHPNFPVEFVPDIPISGLPEEPEVNVYTSRDVLNKIKGSVCSRVEKALQSVSDEQESKSKEKSSQEADTIKNKKQNSILKGLIERIRAALEYDKIIVGITSPEGEKRLEMIERIPNIVHVLWHYFVEERKVVVPIDVAVEKIMHSCSTLVTPDAVKEHLELIRETMPHWLSFIKITQGEYITINKKTDINFMLANIK